MTDCANYSDVFHKYSLKFKNYAYYFAIGHLKRLHYPENSE